MRFITPQCKHGFEKSELENNINKVITKAMSILYMVSFIESTIKRGLSCMSDDGNDEVDGTDTASRP